MTFKWTYLFVALVLIAVVAASGVFGGFAGGFSYALGLAAILIGGALVYLAMRPERRRLREGVEDANVTAAPFVGYPTDQTLAIFESEDDALRATQDLEASGYSSVRRFAGMDGAAELDSQGAAHGGAAAIERALEQVTSDVSNLASYDEAVRRGGIVLGVQLPKGERPHRAAEIMRHHRGHDVRYFSEMMVETLDADPGRTRAD